MATPAQQDLPTAFAEIEAAAERIVASAGSSRGLRLVAGRNSLTPVPPWNAALGRPY
jgi:hypothetical protein